MNRAFGMQRAGVLAWTRVQADPYDERIRDKAEEEIWVYPKNLYDRYRSATLHTASHKFKVPKRVWQGLSVAVAFIGILWLGWLFLIKPSNAEAAKKEEQGAGALPAAGALAPLGVGMPAHGPSPAKNTCKNANHVPSFNRGLHPPSMFELCNRSPSCTVWPRAPLSRTPLAPA